MGFNEFVLTEGIVFNINEMTKPTKIPANYYLNLALAYAKRGFKVFPVSPYKGKNQPYKGSHGKNDATSDHVQICKMWQQHPDGVPAISCADSGIVIIDVDCKKADSEKAKYKNGFRLLNKLIEKLGKLPKTVIVYTKSGGLHLYFKLPKDIKLKRNLGYADLSEFDDEYNNEIFRRLKCIDIQTNFYCICGGVFRQDGTSYRFAKEYTFDDIKEIPELPQKWVNFLKEGKIQKYINKSNINTESNIEIDGTLEDLMKCDFIEYCVKNAAIISNDEWYLLACVLTKLKNGFEIFDKLSQPYPDYTFEKTKYKFEHVKSHNYSCRCSTIAKTYPGCKECRKNLREIIS